MKVKVSDYIADFLVDNGIDTMFMITRWRSHAFR